MSVAEQLSLQRDFVDGDTLWCLMRNTGVKVSRATVYGALKWLTALGFVERKVVEEKKTLFKLRKRRVELGSGKTIVV